MKKMLGVLATLAAMAAFAFSPAAFSQSAQTRSGSSINVANAAPPHPLIHRAINALEVAKAELQDAAHTYCGHREEALGAVDAALHQLHLAIECANNQSSDPRLGLSEPVEVSAGGGPHPRITAALEACRSARNNLANAAEVYCGHRA
ncbi:MAG TPA: hypothetical protein VLZ81_14705, partial [Blastocatellia bacterium]|nr:hypothetical protein [Blastocatellia bacterium]